MTRDILRRIQREAGAPELVEILSDRLAGTDLQSVLLEVYRRRAERLAPGDVERQLAANPFVRASVVPQREQLELDRLAVSLLPPDFESIELSPVSPLGVCSAIAGMSQDKAVSTSRNVEVSSDPTNVMALVAADRRRALRREDPRSVERVRLATSQRVLRPQKPDIPAAWSHFRLFALVTAGRHAGATDFEAETIVEHAGFYLDLLARCRREGYGVREVEVRLTSFRDERDAAVLEELVAAPLRATYPDVRFELDPGREQGRTYYSPFAFQVHVHGEDGPPLFLCDGGSTDWTQKLLGDRRERLTISALGTERMLAVLGRR